MTDDFTTPDQPVAASQLIQQLEEQAILVDQLRGLAPEQAIAVSQGDTDRLLSVLAQRQGRIEQLLSHQKACGDAQHQIEEGTMHASEVERARIRKLVSELSTTLEDVIEGDAADRDTLTEQLAVISDELGVTETAQSARRAYGALQPDRGILAASTTRFTDQQG